MTVAALEDGMGAEELVEWQAFFRIQHEEHERAMRKHRTPHTQDGE